MSRALVNIMTVLIITEPYKNDGLDGELTGVVVIIKEIVLRAQRIDDYYLMR